jgi:MraZ protein
MKMLIGQYEHTLDNKGRLTLPSEYGAELAAGIVLTRGMESCLYLFPRAEFERLGDRLRELSLTDSRARKLRRWLFPQAHAAEPDRQRRVVIPQWLRDVAGITDKVLIAGMDNYIELWNPDGWRDQDRALRAELDDEDFFASLNV